MRNDVDTTPTPLDESWMALALEEAEAAALEGEAPVGAVVVVDREVVARGRNRREHDHDPTAHAELLAVRDAAARLGRWRLSGTTVYVTLEPCPMCAGALILARVDRVVFGAYDPKAGACGSVVNLFEAGRFNHRPEIVVGVMAAACARVLTEFFAERRVQQREVGNGSDPVAAGQRGHGVIR